MLGTKIAVNEYIAFLELQRQADLGLSTSAKVIASYALCGFSNFSSIAIQIGGISALAPERRKDLASFGLRAMAGGILVSYINACIAGLLIA